MDLGLDGRRYVVTGGTRGLGRAVARELVDEGAHVLVASRSPDHVDAAVADLGERTTGLAVDLTDPGAPARLLAGAREQLGGIDGAFVSYGGPPTGPAVDLDDEALAASVERALVGPVRVVRDVAAALGDGGAVVLLTSTSSVEPIPDLAGSNVTRPGLWGYVKTLADEVAPRGVRVNALIPGSFATERMRELQADTAAREHTTPEEVAAAMAAEVPLGRLGEPRELGRVVTFLLSPAASYVTGSAWVVDGGKLRGL